MTKKPAATASPGIPLTAAERARFAEVKFEDQLLRWADAIQYGRRMTKWDRYYAAAMLRWLQAESWRASGRRRRGRPLAASTRDRAVIAQTLIDQYGAKPKAAVAAAIGGGTVREQDRVERMLRKLKPTTRGARTVADDAEVKQAAARLSRNSGSK